MAPAPDHLPRRDFILIPLIVLVTALVMLGGAELLAGHYFQEAQQGVCAVPDRLIAGYRYTPNCTYFNKAAEGPLVKYVFNDCGYRTREPCRPKPAGALRIVLLGASTAEGFKTAYDDALAPRAAAELTRLCRRPVEIQNMGQAGFAMIQQYLRLNEALALKPDLVMLLITPYDLVNFTDPALLANRDHPERVAPAEKRAQPAEDNAPAEAVRISALLSESHAALAAQYFLFQNRNQYIKLFLLHGDKADYLRVPLTAGWEKRLAEFDLLAGEMADRVHRAGLPFAIVLTPQRIQAALTDPHGRPPGVDPAEIGRRIGAIAARHDISFVDTLNAFAHVPSPEKLFFPVDGHMTAGGHHVVGHAMAQWLSGSRIPPFEHCDGD